MKTSVRGVEAYRRSRLIDVVTSDEDKVAPVYRLEEVCELMRDCTLDVVREMLEYTLKRLEHKNPIVKQKTLRFIKYAAGKGGSDFKREMQRQAGVLKALFHYKGQLDALKGDALNKAVRDTAHEAVAAIFGTEEPTTRMEDVGKRIQGFGSSNYDSRPREEDKKSVLTGLVGFGSQTIKQSLEMIQNYNHYSGSGPGPGTNRNNFTGTYRTQGLRRSLTAERDKPFQKEEKEWNVRDAEAEAGVQTSSSKDNSSFKSEVSNGSGSYEDGRTDSTVESRLLDSLTVPGGIRLTPTRETLHAFTTTAQNLDAANLVNSLEMKLKAHSWQVRFKALCLIEAAVRQKDDNPVLDSLTAMFEEDASAVVDSLQSPQATLRDKAKKVLEMLGGGEKDGERVTESSAAPPKPVVADLPDLMDTGDFDLTTDTLESTPTASKPEQPVPTVAAPPPPPEMDLFGDWVDEPAANAPPKDAEADPFAGMSFHSSDTSSGNTKEPDLFSGLDMDTGRRADNGGAVEGSGRGNDGTSLFEGLSVTPGGSTAAAPPQDSLVDLMGGLSTSNGAPTSRNANEQLYSLSSLDRPVQQQQQPVPLAPTSSFGGSGNISDLYQMAQPQRVGGGGGGGGQAGGVFPVAGATPQMYFIPPGNGQFVQGFAGGMPGAYPANGMLQPGMQAGQMNYAAGMNPAIAQQFAPGFAGMPRYGGLQTSTSNGGGLQQGYPDSFDFSGDPSSRYASVAEAMKKEDNKAFDFITEHVSSQLGSKKSR